MLPFSEIGSDRMEERERAKRSVANVTTGKNGGRDEQVGNGFTYSIGQSCKNNV